MNKIKQTVLTAFLCLPTFLMGQTDDKIITGKVSSDYEELIGVQVLEIDKNERAVSGATTDFSGNFSIQIKNTGNKLRFSYIGFVTKDLPIGNQRKFDVVLEENNRLSEVVISAKVMHSDGTLNIPQREISGAVQKLNVEKFAGVSVPSIDDLMQGQIAGLDIVGNSGNLGSGSTLRIRGTTSINSNSEPLIVVNDVPFENNIPASFDYASANQEQFANLLNINPSDIEEITVLKDGASAAIWGSRGANGVINIRTKKGAKGPTRVQYIYRFSGKQQPQGLNMLSGDDYTMMMKQAYFNPRQDVNAANIPEFNYDPTFSEYQNFNKNTDWVKAITQYGFTHDHNLTVSGGGDKANFRLSFGYYDETGIVIKQELQRLTNRMNFEYRVSDRIRFSSDFALTYTDNHKNLASDVGDAWNTENLLSMAYRKMPNVSVYQQDVFGNDTKLFYTIPQSSVLHNSQKNLLNPVALAHLASNNDKNVRIMPKFNVRYDILDPEKTTLRYNAYISFDYENNDNSRFLPREVTTVNWSDQNVNRSYSKEAEALTVRSDQNLTYVPWLGEAHNLMLYGSWQIETNQSQYEELERSGLASSLIPDPTLPGDDRTFKSGLEARRMMALLGRIHYTFLNRYILDVSFCRDADTRFGPNNRWGSFPAVSGKWIISDEAFLRPVEWLSEWGIRGGWGVAGNAPSRNYLYFSRYDGNWSYSNSYMDLSAVKPSSVKLSNLKWETSTSYNLGFDLNLFDFKYNMDFNVYTRRTKDLLFPDQQIPGSTGFTSLAFINGGVMDNRGWEFNMFTDRMIKIRDFSFDVNLNLSNYVNDIVSLSPAFVNSYNKEFNYENGTYLSRIQQGNALGSIYGFRYKGVYQYDKYAEGRTGTSPFATDAGGNVIVDGNGKPVPMYFAYGTTSSYIFRGGDAIYEDINHDGTIDELDIVYLGNCNPKINGGFGSTVRYKHFSMIAFFNFRYGNKILNRTRMDAERMYNNDNQSTAVNWRWRKDGDLTEIPRALYDYGYNWLGSDRFVEDGSFLRFKYLIFAYEFDKKVIKPLALNQLSLNLSLNNLWTFTKYTGVDPEISPNMSPAYGMIGISEDKGRTPRAQYFTFGVTVGF